MIAFSSHTRGMAASSHNITIFSVLQKVAEMTLRHLTGRYHGWLSRRYSWGHLQSSSAGCQASFHAWSPTYSTADTDTSSIRNRAAIEADFEQLGLSKEETETILKKYPAYLKWDWDERFRPTVAQWQREFGREGLATALCSNNSLLSHPHARLLSVSAMLTDLGVNQSKQLLARNSMLLQSGLPALKAGAAELSKVGIPPKSVPEVLQRRPKVLRMSPNYLQQRFDFYARIVGCPVDSQEFSKFLVNSDRWLLDSSFKAQQDGLAFLAAFGLNSDGLIRSLKTNVCSIAFHDLHDRVQKFRRNFDISMDDVVYMVSAQPIVLYTPQEALAANWQSFVQHGFTSQDLQNMFVKVPGLFRLNLSTHQAKWLFLESVIGLTTADLVKYPRLLTASLTDRLVPRWEFFCKLDAHGLLMRRSPSEYLCATIKDTEGTVARRFNKPGAGLYNISYDKAFKDICKARYNATQLRKSCVRREVRERRGVRSEVAGCT